MSGTTPDCMTTVQENKLAAENHYYHRNPDYIFRRIVDEMVLVPIHQDLADMDSIYTLNEVGAFIWEKLAEPARITDLKEMILEEYDSNTEQVLNDLHGFLDEMCEFGAVSQGSEL